MMQSVCDDDERELTRSELAHGEKLLLLCVIQQNSDRAMAEGEVELSRLPILEKRS